MSMEVLAWLGVVCGVLLIAVLVSLLRLLAKTRRTIDHKVEPLIESGQKTVDNLDASVKAIEQSGTTAITQTGAAAKDVGTAAKVAAGVAVGTAILGGGGALYKALKPKKKWYQR